MKRRLFIALALPATVKMLLQAYQTTLKQHLGEINITWVKPANMHLTLAFLGDSGIPQEELKRALHYAARRFQPFELSTADIGAFPSFSRPSVLWLGVGDETKQLSALQKNLEHTLEGFYKPSSVYKAHLTIGRIRTFGQANTIAAAVAKVDAKDALSWHVKAVNLYSSAVTSSGPKYTLLHSEALTAPQN